MLQTGRAEKADKKWGHLFSFHVPFLSYDPFIVRKSAFFQFCADLRKKSQYTKAIYIYGSYEFSRNGIACYAMT